MAKTSWYPGCGWPSLEEKIRDLASYHTQPDDLGRVAAGARARKLAVTHLMRAPSSRRRAGTSRGRWWWAATCSRSSAQSARSAASTARAHGASSAGSGR